MKPSQSIFRSSSWEEMVRSTNNTEIHPAVKNGGSYIPKQLINTVTKRVRCLRRHRLISALKTKRLFQHCSASDLLSHSASTLIGKVLVPSMDSSETALPQRDKHSSSKSKRCTFVDDDISDISLSSVEDESSDVLNTSSLEYVWILGMQCVVFDVSTTHNYW